MDSRARPYGYIGLFVVLLAILLYVQPLAQMPMPQPIQTETLVLKP